MKGIQSLAGWIVAAILGATLFCQNFPQLRVISFWLGLFLGGVVLIQQIQRARKQTAQLHDALAHEKTRSERLHAYLQRLIDVIPQPVYIKDAESRYILVNDAFCSERGRSKDELVGKISWQFATEPALAQAIRHEDAAIFAGEIIYKEECLPHMYTGAERYRLISKAACLDEEGRPVIVGANFDITPWRVAERDLQAALAREVNRRERVQQYVQRLIDVIPHPVYVKDADSRYVLVNEAFARDRGLERDKLVGSLSVGQTHNRIVNEAVLREDAEILAGRIILKEEHKAHPFNGRDRYRVVAKGRCLNDEGEPVIVCAAFDVTEWRLAEIRLLEAKEEAERANEAKSRFLANISHELRTPMHAILGFAHLGSEKTNPNNDRLRSYFEKIGQSGTRLLYLLNDLLDLSKLEAGHAEIIIRPLDLRLCMHEAIEEIQPLLDHKELRIELDARKPAEILGDTQRIMQVLRNLLGNAIKFSPPNGLITLLLRPTKLSLGQTSTPAIELIVRDEGYGFNNAELEKVFAAFVQGSNQDPGAGGTGLGLAICRQIVAAHHGQIFASNRREGGAELIVCLPIDPRLPEFVAATQADSRRFLREARTA